MVNCIGYKGTNNHKIIMNLIKKKFIKTPNISLLDSVREIARNPFVDWILILFISSVIAVILIVGGINLYTRVVSGDIQSTDNSFNSSARVFNKKDLIDIIDQFNNKKNLQEQTKKGYSGPSDPSL